MQHLVDAYLCVSPTEHNRPNFCVSLNRTELEAARKEERGPTFEVANYSAQKRKHVT